MKEGHWNRYRKLMAVAVPFFGLGQPN